VLAAEEATFWEIFTKRGLPLEGGGAWLLTRSISLARAKELALIGDPLPAAEAERWGLVNRCVPGAELDATARDWAKRLASGRRTGHIKGQLNAAWEQTMQQSFVTEVTLLGLGAPPPPPERS
jgi:2-(1,2-epoxy-1,2-dihydrophenyl)acetyl-CoA isomerase